MASALTYEIRPARESDAQDILEHMRKFYFRDLPLAAFLEIVTDENPICEEFEESSMRHMAEPSLNIIAVSDGKIIGVTLNEIIKKNYREGHPKKYVNEKFGLLSEFIFTFEKEVNLFGKYPEFEEAFFVHNLSIDTAYRGHGIAQSLVAKTLEWAKELGYGLYTINASSYFTSLVSQKLGLDFVGSHNFGDYKVNGEAVLKLPAPHKAIIMYAKRLL